jgi:hypothetical protein
VIFVVGHTAVRVAEVDPAARVAVVKVKACGPMVLIETVRSLSKYFRIRYLCWSFKRIPPRVAFWVEALRESV